MDGGAEPRLQVRFLREGYGEVGAGAGVVGRKRGGGGSVFWWRVGGGLYWCGLVLGLGFFGFENCYAVVEVGA